MSYYFGPVRDMAHAGFLQARFEGRNPDDRFDALKTAIQCHTLATLAYALGQDAIGDAAHAAFGEALIEDGLHPDDEDDARDYCKRYWSNPASCLKALGQDFETIARVKAAAAAKVAA